MRRGLTGSMRDVYNTGSMRDMYNTGSRREYTRVVGGRYTHLVVGGRYTHLVVPFSSTHPGYTSPLLPGMTELATGTPLAVCREEESWALTGKTAWVERPLRIVSCLTVREERPLRRVSSALPEEKEGKIG